MGAFYSSCFDDKDAKRLTLRHLLYIAETCPVRSEVVEINKGE